MSAYPYEEDTVHALTIVCPVDYSDCSKRALHYAGALAEHFGARLVVLHVFDPMLVASSSIHQRDLLGLTERKSCGRSWRISCQRA